MLEEKDLQAIAALIDARLDAKLAAQEERLTAKIEQAQRDAVEQSRQNMLLWYENRIEPQLRLLAEGHAAILERLEPRIEDAEQRLDKLETDVMLLKSAM